jgi:hypothetical protein
VPPAVFYRYSPDRKGEQAGALLADCTGYLHADAYAGFKHLYEPDLKTGQSRLLEVSCWSARKILCIRQDACHGKGWRVERAPVSIPLRGQ